jgi:hypothetical protein
LKALHELGCWECHNDNNSPFPPRPLPSRAHACLLQELPQFALDDANKAISLNKASKSAYKKKVEVWCRLHS